MRRRSTYIYVDNIIISIASPTPSSPAESESALYAKMQRRESKKIASTRTTPRILSLPTCTLCFPANYHLSLDFKVSDIDSGILKRRPSEANPIFIISHPSYTSRVHREVVF